MTQPLVASLAAIIMLVTVAPRAQAPASATPVRLEHVGADTDAAFRVVATIIVGPTECVVWDGQYKVSDGRRLADRIAETCGRVKAMVISHADHDHYMGAMAVVERFPGTPVYMHPSTLADFNERSATDLAAERKRPTADAPERLVTPQPLPSVPLTVDGHRLEVLGGLTGDVQKPASSVMWIPSIRAALVADLAFNGIHPWLGDSTRASRAAWRASLQKVADLNPTIVVPGHKADVTAPDSPDVLAFMRTYLEVFDRQMDAAATPQDLAQAMRERYPDLKIPGLMMAGARMQFRK